MTTAGAAVGWDSDPAVSLMASRPATVAEVLALEPPTPPAALVRRRVLSVLPPDVASLLEESSP